MWQATQYQIAGEVCNVYKWACDDELRPTLVTEITVTQGPPYVQYNALKIAWRAKITLLMIEFSRCIN